MLESLVKLADYFDRKKLYNKANVIDAFIIMAEDLNLESSGDIPIDLESHPLGKLLIEYIKNIYLHADSGVLHSTISLRDLRRITDLGIRTNSETGKLFGSMDENSNPISPLQFKSLVASAAKLVKDIYVPIGKINFKLARVDLVTLYKGYEDLYLEDYMGLSSGEENFLGRDLGTAYFEANSLKPSKDQSLQDNFEKRIKDNLNKRPDPERERLMRERHLMRTTFKEPKEHLHALLPPKD